MLCTSGFVDDVMFSHNGVNRQESKTVHMFCPVCQVAALVRCQTTLVEFARWQHWGEVCHLWLYLVESFWIHKQTRLLSCSHPYGIPFEKHDITWNNSTKVDCLKKYRKWKLWHLKEISLLPVMQYALMSCCLLQFTFYKCCGFAG